MARDGKRTNVNKAFLDLTIDTGMDYLPSIKMTFPISCKRKYISEKDPFLLYSLVFIGKYSDLGRNG
jgi:hypothetical protein